MPSKQIGFWPMTAIFFIILTAILSALILIGQAPSKERRSIRPPTNIFKESSDPNSELYIKLTADLPEASPDQVHNVKTWKTAKFFLLEDGRALAVTNRNTFLFQDNRFEPILFSHPAIGRSLFAQSLDMRYVDTILGRQFFHEHRDLYQNRLVRVLDARWYAGTESSVTIDYVYGHASVQDDELNATPLIDCSFPDDSTVTTSQGLVKGIAFRKGLLAKYPADARTPILLPSEAQFAVTCIRNSDSPDITYRDLNGFPSVFGQPFVDFDKKIVFIPFGTDYYYRVRFDDDATDAADRYSLIPARYVVTTSNDSYRIALPWGSRICRATESGPQCSIPSDERTTEDSMVGFVTKNGLFGMFSEGLFDNAVYIESRISSSTAADFAKQSLSLNRAFGDESCTYSDEHEIEFAGSRAYTFVAHGCFEERVEGLSDNSPREAARLVSPLRIMYIHHHDRLLRIAYEEKNEEARTILETWEFTDDVEQ